MVNVQFNSEVKGVTECNCHHISFNEELVFIHFTKLIIWHIPMSRIKKIG